MEEKVEVLDKDYNSIAFFTKDDLDAENRMIDPEVNISQNGESFFTFTIKSDCEKWNQIKDPTNLYKVNNRIYSPLSDNSYTRNITENSADTVTVRADEIWNLLSKKYVRAWNSETGFETIDDFMVVIVSGGDLPLVNDGNRVNPTYAIGTAGYVLQGLLYGSGWTLENCSVTGVYDFETDMEDLLTNIKKVQDLWGGILVWDSLNKTLRLEDEEVYKQYEGYLAKKGKNIRNIEDVSSNNIITRLIPLGEAGLNIKDVNNDIVYLEDHTYVQEDYYEIINNGDIYDQQQLKTWGLRKLSEKCKPQKTLNVNIVDLRQREENKFETFDINSTIDIEYDDIIEQLRVTSWSYKVFQISNANITLSNVIQNSRDIFTEIAEATYEVQKGRLKSNNVFTSGTKKSVKEQIDKLDESTSSITNNIGDGRSVNASTIINSINNDNSDSKINVNKINTTVVSDVIDVTVNGTSVLNPQRIAEVIVPISASDINAMPINQYVTSFWYGTQDSYDAISEKSNTTLYLIPGKIYLGTNLIIAN